jgi:hypothetical protein
MFFEFMAGLPSHLDAITDHERASERGLWHLSLPSRINEIAGRRIR